MKYLDLRDPDYELCSSFSCIRGPCQVWNSSDVVFIVSCVAKDENRKILINDLNIVNCNSFHFLIISFVLIRLFFFYWLCFSKGKKHRCQSGCQNYKMDINWDIPEQMHWGLTQQRQAQLTLFTSAHQKTLM